MREARSLQWGRGLSYRASRLHPETATMRRVPHLDMPTIVLSTFALVGCAFLVYAWLCWLREELDLKRPAHRDRVRKPLPQKNKNEKKQIPRFARSDSSREFRCAAVLRPYMG